MKMRTLSLKRDQQTEILDFCAQASPHEACGLLLGNEGEVQRVVLSENISPTPTRHFEIDPALIIQYQKISRAGGVAIMGHFHSHPEGQALPSDTDRAHLYDKNMVWCIVSVAKGRAMEMKAYVPDASGHDFMPLKISIL